MGLKGIFSKLFAWRDKPPESGGEKGPEKAEPSPYAKFSEPEPVPSAKPQGRTTVKDVFLLENLPAKPLGTVGLLFPEQGALLIRDPFREKAGRLIRFNGEISSTPTPLFGDWTGSGRESLGFYDPKLSVFSLWNQEDHKEPDIQFFFGPPELGWVPLVGDWDGDGKDGIGLYDPASAGFVLRNELGEGDPEMYFMYGPPGLGWIPLAGDWDGDGKDGIGVYDPQSGVFLLRNALSGGGHELRFQIKEARPDWVPLVGDWDGDGMETVGAYDPANRTFHLRNQSDNGETEQVFRFGPQGVSGRPFATRWAP